MKPLQDWVGSSATLLGPQAASAKVRAPLSYLRESNVKPFSYAHEPPAGVPWESGEYDEFWADIHDARQAGNAFSMDVEGFLLVNAPTQLTDFTDAEQIRRVYFEEAKAIALQVTGAKQAFVFDHLVRRRESDRAPLTFGKRGADGLAAANGRIHNDYSEASGLKRLGLVLQDPGILARIRRYSIFNIWRSINGPVLDTPLAVCDARSVSPADLVCSEVRYPRRTGEIYAVKHAPRHRWWYYPEMDRHEALVFKQFDSITEGVARFVPHAAFDLPHIPADAPLRESIELRCLVVYDEVCMP
jgi:hypothetical protein